jgi:hypothetical protein
MPGGPDHNRAGQGADLPGPPTLERMEARRISAWRSRYRVTDDGGREITTWDSSFWRSGGVFELDGRRLEVRANVWGTRYTMVDALGDEIASANRVGRKRWTVEAGGLTYHFRRKSMWSHEQQLVLGDAPVGSIRKLSFWGSAVSVELPGLSPEIQVFVLGVVISMWKQEAAAAAGASGGG